MTHEQMVLQETYRQWLRTCLPELYGLLYANEQGPPDPDEDCSDLG